jgi:hypothetical protein
LFIFIEALLSRPAPVFLRRNGRESFLRSKVFIFILISFFPFYNELNMISSLFSRNFLAYSTRFEGSAGTCINSLLSSLIDANLCDEFFAPLKSVIELCF